RPHLHSFPTRRSSDLVLSGTAFSYPARFRRFAPPQLLPDFSPEHPPVAAVLPGQAAMERLPALPRRMNHGQPAEQQPTGPQPDRSEEHTSELQSRENL